MAAKADTVKLLQEIRGYAEITNRRPPPRAIDVPQAAMRPHVLRTALPVYKRWIRIEVQDTPETAVKITWLKPTTTASLLPPLSLRSTGLALRLP
jgi:hypothetical protein